MGLAVGLAILAALAGSCAVGGRGDALAAYARAASAYEAGYLTKAVALAKEAVAADRRLPAPLVLIGKASFFMDEDAAAIRALERAVRLTPRGGEAALWLARAYRAAGRSDDAKRTCELAIASDPSSIAALRLSAMLALDEGEAGAAYAFLERAVEAASEAGLAYTDRAALRWAAGDRDGALQDLEAAAVSLPPGSAASGAATALRERVAGSPR
jgi:tetratricopeptide (TPR) repeat protein